MWRPILLMALTVGGAALAAQGPDKELVLTISSREIEDGIVSEVAWADGTLIIQTAAIGGDGQLAPRYHAAPGRGMQVMHLASAPPGVDDYWRRKASRTSPTGLGRIRSFKDSKMPMYGIGALDQRVLNANQMGGVDLTFEVRLGELVLHSRKDVEPYDGEVWAWSPARLNRIAYVDGEGHLWIARADGTRPERIAKGRYTLPAWSDDGRLIAVAERRDNGRQWSISVLHLPERYRD